MDLTLEGFLNITAIAASLFMAGLTVSLGWQAGIRLAALTTPVSDSGTNPQA